MPENSHVESFLEMLAVERSVNVPANGLRGSYKNRDPK